MHLGDGLVDSVLILLSLEAVVLDVVDQLKEEHAHESIVELILQGLPSKEKEDSGANGSMDDEVHNHLVVEEHDNGWDVVSEFLLDSLDFSLPGVDVGADAGLEDEGVEGLVSIGGGWVLWGAHILVVALKVLVQEVRVHELSVNPGSGKLVEPLAFVEELVSADGVESAEVAPLEAE